QVADVAVEPLGPKGRTRFGIDQLRVDSDLLAGALDAPFKNIAYPELAADLLYIDRLVLVSERGVARNHQAALDAREIGGQILCDTIGKIFLLRFIAEIGKGQHHNRHPRSGLRPQASRRSLRLHALIRVALAPEPR